MSTIIATTNNNPETISAAINNSIENSQISKESLTEIYSLYCPYIASNESFSSTDFRPADNEMIADNIEDNDEFKSLTIVHGHNGKSNVNEAPSTREVININSSIGHNRTPVMAIIPNKNYTLHESKPWWDFSRLWQKV